MIDVKIERNETGNIINFTVSGHADAGPHGYDLVCAAVSAVTFGTYNAIEALTGVALPLKLGKTGGFFHLQVEETKQPATNEKIQWLLEGMVVSLETIARDYGKHIRIKVSGR